MADKDVRVTLVFDDKGSAEIKRVAKDVIDQFQQMGQVSQSTASSMSTAEQQTQQLGTGLEKLKTIAKSTFVQMAAGMGLWMGLSQAISAVTRNILSIVTLGRMFQSEFFKIRSITDANAGTTELWKESLLSLNVAYGNVIQTTGAASIALREFGDDVAKASTIIKEAAAVSYGAFVPAEQAASMLARVIKGYRLEVKDAAKVSSVLIKATQLGDVSFSEIGSTIGRVSLQARQAGLSLADLVGTFTTLASESGASSFAAVMGLRTLLYSLARPSKRIQEETKKMGIEFSANAVRTMGWVEWLTKLSDVVDNNAERLERLGLPARALAPLFEILSSRFDVTKRNIQTLTEAYERGTGSQDVMLRKVKSFGFWLDSFKELTNRFKIAIWDGVSGTLIKAGGSADSIMKKMKNLTETFYKTGKAIGEAIGDVITFFIKWKDIIIKVAEAYLIFIAAQKTGVILAKTQLLIDGLSMAMRNLALGFATSAGSALRGQGVFRSLWQHIRGLSPEVKGLTGVLKNLGPIAVTAFAGWNVGRLIGEITGLDKSLQKLMENVFFKGKTKGTGELLPGRDEKKIRSEYEAMKELNKLAKEAGITDINQYRQTYGSWVTALEAARPVLNAEIERIRKLRENNAAYGMSLEDLRTKMEEYGYLTGTELKEKYDILTDASKRLKKEMLPSEFEKLKKEIRELAIALGLASDLFERYGVKTAAEVKQETDKLIADYFKLKKAVEQGASSNYQFAKAIEELNNRAKDLTDEITFTTQGIERMATVALPKTKTGFAELVKMVPSVAESMATFDEETYGLWTGFETMEQVAQKLGVTLKSSMEKTLNETIIGFSKLKKYGQLTLQDQKKLIQDIIQLYVALGMRVPQEWIRAYQQTEKATRNRTAELFGLFSGVVAGVSTLFSTMAEDLRASITSDLSYAERTAIETKLRIAGAWASGLEVVAKTIAKLSEVWKTLKKQGELSLKGIFKGIGPELAAELGVALGNIVAGGRKNFAGIGSTIGGLIGSIIPGIGTAIGSFVGGILGGLFKKKKSAEEKMKEAVGKLADELTKKFPGLGKVSESTAQKIYDLTKKLGTLGAQLVGLADIMRDTGISYKNFNQYVAEIGKAIEMLGKTNLPWVREAFADLQESIGNAFSQMLEYIQKIGNEGNAAFVKLIQSVRASGQHIKEIDEYVMGWLNKGIEGLKKVVAQIAPASSEIMELQKQYDEAVQTLMRMRHGTQAYIDQIKLVNQLARQIDKAKKDTRDYSEDLARATRQAIAMFNAVLQQTGSMSEALAVIQEPMNMLLEKYQILGKEVPASLLPLKKVSEIRRDHQELFDAIDGNVEILKALGNTGFLTDEILADTATGTISYFQKLKSLGVDTRSALAVIAPTLAELEWYSKQYGFTLDSGTQALIRQAKEAGVFREHAKDLIATLETGFNKITSKLEDLLNLFGQKFPSVIGQSVNTAVQHLYKIPAAMEEMAGTYSVAVAASTAGVISGQGGGEWYVGAPVQPFIAHQGEVVKISRPNESSSDTKLLQQLLTELRNAKQEHNITFRIEAMDGESVKKVVVGKIVPLLESLAKREAFIIPSNAVRG